MSYVLIWDVLRRMKLVANVSEHPVCSIFIGVWVRNVAVVLNSVMRNWVWNRLISRAGCIFPVHTCIRQWESELCLRTNRESARGPVITIFALPDYTILYRTAIIPSSYMHSARVGEAATFHRALQSALLATNNWYSWRPRMDDSRLVLRHSSASHCRMHVWTGNLRAG
jgi:hypothetical protein